MLSIGLAINVASAESGNDQGRDWIVSGTELIKALEGKSDDAALQSEAGRISSGARGSAYIAGVADATSGTGWCGAGSVLPMSLQIAYTRIFEASRRSVLQGKHRHW